jgi:hypothetical protein
MSLRKKAYPLPCETVKLGGLTVHVYVSEIDGRTVIDVDSSEYDEHSDKAGVPEIRVYVNDKSVFGEYAPGADEGY